jgi:glycosyltransferase involved in cell wall biosynthesis
MKILFVCQYFYPEVFRGNDIAFHWAEEGHDVHVVCGIPNYPHGKFYEGYGLFKRMHEEIVQDVQRFKEFKGKVRVTRLPIIPRGNNKIMLMLNYFSYLMVAWVYMLFHALFYKYDRVFVQQLSPVMMSAPGVLYKRIRKVPLYTWVLDLWPESLTAAGGINNKYVLGFFRHYVKSEYKHSDKILISSRSFEKSVLEYGNYKDKIVYFPQWSDATVSHTESTDNTEKVASLKIDQKSDSKINQELENLRIKYHLPELPEGFKLMFAGAVGEAHGFECTMQAALMTKEHKDIKWVIVGDGRRLDWVRDFVKEHGLDETVVTLGRFPAETMPWFFKQADVMLVTLNDAPLFKLYAPAKISSYMAAGKPIVAVLNGEGAEVIREAECGWSLPAGDAEGFAKLAVELSQIDKKVLDDKGQNSLKYYNEHYVKEKSLEKLDDLIGIK